MKKCGGVISQFVRIHTLYLTENITSDSINADSCDFVSFGRLEFVRAKREIPLFAKSLKYSKIFAISHDFNFCARFYKMRNYATLNSYEIFALEFY